jgi:capsular polysaccharide biosynthesis protein
MNNKRTFYADLSKKIKTAVKPIKLKQNDFISIPEFIDKYGNNEAIKKYPNKYMDIYCVNNARILHYNTEWAFLCKTINRKTYFFKEFFNIGLNCKELRRKGDDYAIILNHKISEIKPKELDEVCFLLHLFSYNYWHFTFELLPIVVTMEENGYNGKYIVFDFPHINDFFNILKIDPERIIKISGNSGTNFIVKNIYMTTRYLETRAIANALELYSEVRKRILENLIPTGKSYPKRLYVRRIGTRKVKNETEVIEHLRKYDFEVMVPEEHSVAEQIRFFHNADIIVTPHGANSTSAVFMRNGAYFIEAFSLNWQNPCVLLAIKLCNLHYTPLIESTRAVKASAIKASGEDFMIKLNLLEAVVSSAVNNIQHD